MSDLIMDSQNNFINAFKFASIGMALADINGRFLMVNNSLCRITGYAENELLKLTFQDITHPEDLEKDLYLVNKVIKKEIEFYEMEKRYFHKEGHIVWIHLSVTIYQEPGKDYFFISQVQDITDRKRMENQLRQSEAQFRRLVDFSPIPMIVHDSDKILYINKAVNYITKMSEDQILDRTLLEFIHHSNHLQYKKAIQEIFQNGQMVNIEIKIVLPDGEEKDVEIDGTLIHFQGEEAIQIVIRDITLQKKWKLTSQKLMQESDKMNLVGELAAGIAHEIRNPLTSIKGFLQLNELNMREEFSELLFSEIERINLIITELLHLAKPSFEEYSHQKLWNIMDQVIALMTSEANLHNVTIQKSIITDNPTIYCVRGRIKQVFINLIKNAIEAMPDGGKLTIEVMQRNNEIYVSFTDEGIGIPQEILERLGNPFFTTKECGTGLGIMVSKNIIENHGGTLNIFSTYLKGTMVEITFPTPVN